MDFRAGCPVHVTLRVVERLPSLRERAAHRVILGAFAGGCARFGMRLVEWSVVGNHMHLIVEAGDRRALARGMQGLAVRLAKALDRCWNRAGRVFEDRYHARVLPTPSEVRTTLSYVLQNARNHGIAAPDADPCSSAPWFDGWREGGPARAVQRPAWLLAPRSWLLSRGWRRLGLLEVLEPRVRGAER